MAAFLSVLLLQAIGDSAVNAYSMFGQKWCDNNGTISIQSSAGSSSYTLAKQPVYDAASHWSAVSSNFDFSIVAENVSADVWVLGQANGVGSWFGLESHTYYPFTNCMIASNVTFNTSYGWNPSSTYCDYSSGWVSVYTIGLHELGHSHGLNHSSNSSAVMYQYAPFCAHKYLHQDDIDGIRDIYDY